MKDWNIKKIGYQIKSFFYRIGWFYWFLLASSLLIFFFLVYSNRLIRKLAREEAKRVRFYAEVIKFVSSTEASECEQNFLFKNVLRNNLVSVPAIITDENYNIITHNFEKISDWDKEKQQKFLLEELKKMQESDIPPLKIEYAQGRYNYVFYRESETLERLRKYPYMIFGAVIILLGILVVGFYFIRKNEENKLWIALSKETAHQLGTPISGLMGWLELLRSEAPENIREYLEEMEKDINKLQLISRRFSKIGSEPELELLDIRSVIRETAEYIVSRTSKSKVLLEIECNLQENTIIEGNKILLGWVIENLLKNAADALRGKQDGKIIIRCEESEDKILLDIIDNGKGIPPHQRDKIFKPGFTTKKRGWGLGLTLAKRIIEVYHKGRLYLKWSEEGKGTQFRIRLKKNLRKQNQAFS